MIKISVIIPVYNTELYLEQCIDSILAQTVPPYEIILVDDGSTDSSGSICDRYDMQFPIIKCFHQSNGGVSKARNTGLEQASGDFVLFVDSDDYIDNNLLAQLEIKDENPDLVFFQFTSLYENNFYRIRQPIHKLVQEPWNFLLLYQTPKGKMINGVFEDNTIAVYNFRILIRRQLLVKNNIKYNELTVDLQKSRTTL